MKTPFDMLDNLCILFELIDLIDTPLLQSFRSVCYCYLLLILERKKNRISQIYRIQFPAYVFTSFTYICYHDLLQDVKLRHFTRQLEWRYFISIWILRFCCIEWSDMPTMNCLSTLVHFIVPIADILYHLIFFFLSTFRQLTLEMLWQSQYMLVCLNGWWNR